ncbi:GUN4 domain-containing protein [Sphaerospermopsis aphanizomenoides BCCUSP55]|uniref:serine/threonine-protein kinase n=1 Tax=Sphaerospermopsis aphanizomenoides TaxID=459663 RepID=UPI001903CB0E|nr:serine/threonine-protein kinase [Sphaerospermopsis aphanizomenoides]MBK1989878.1 GUN4 domain-containing protein [Sphaerospermopsis aphanizomenoides BCCUSP55]
MQVWTPNTSLQNGQYIIKKVIGGGGFGETYLAEDTEENRLVVIKTLKREQWEKPDFADRQKRFRQEALSLARCHHPHVVEVYDIFLENGLQTIVMEYIEGEDLEKYTEEYTAENGYLSETEALSYIDQIGQALEVVHERGLLHRDVKPNNILLRRKTKEAVLIDFGLAREFQLGKIRSMTASKTEGYAPIEQYERRGDFGYYTDVYALAATLYTLLTLRVPIPANYRAEDDVILQPPQKYNQNISDQVNAAILKGMELEPQNRPQTVREFREILGLINQEVELKSDVGMDYRKLRDLLQAGNWKDADEETRRVMFAVAKRKEEGCLDTESIDNFPCADLRTIDQLWVKYSNGKFGFSVQKKIYQKEIKGGRTDIDEIWLAFGEKVGLNKGSHHDWLHYSDITFDIGSPEGHLPCKWMYFLEVYGWYALLSRRDL